MIGLNILGDRGRSEDEIVAIVKQIGAKYHVVMDNMSLAHKVQAAGATVIYRMHDADDNAQDRADPAAFVQRRHAAAPAGALLYLGNEPYPTQRLADWTMAALVECERWGRKGVILNFPTGNPQPDDWTKFKPVLERAYTRGHVLGLHEYFDVSWRKDYPWHVGRWEALRAVVGSRIPQIVITELGACIGYQPLRGYRWGNVMSDEQYAAELVSVGRYYADHGIHACVFALTRDDSADDWHTFNPRPRVIDALAAFNREVKPPVPQTPVYPNPETLGEPYEAVVTYVNSLYVNLRAEPFVKAADIGDVRVGNKVLVRPQTWPNGGYEWARLEQPAGWVASDLMRFAPLDTVDEPRVKLDVPYVSQLGADANAINNDCPEATALMLIQYNLKRRGLPVMAGLKVNMLVAGGDLKPREDVPKNADYILALLRDYCAEGRQLTNVTPDQLADLIDAQRPVIVLTTYDVVKPGDTFKGNHWLVLTGYGKHGFYGLDSYKANGEVYIRTGDLQRGMKQAYASPLAVALV